MDQRLLYTEFNGKTPGRHAPGPRQYQLTHLWEHHHKMLRLALTGWQPKDIALEIGVTPQTVANVINSALGQKLLSEMRGAANKEAVSTAVRIQEMNAKALDVLEEILDNADAPMALRAKVAMDNLSRAGFAPQVNIKGTFDHNHFDASDVERIKLLAIEAARRQGCLVLEDQTPQSEALIPGDCLQTCSTKDEMVGQAAAAKQTSVSAAVDVEFTALEGGCGG